MTVTTRPVSAPDAVLGELARQLEHWRLAAQRLADPNAVAAPAAWQTLEHYLGVSLRATIAAATAELGRRIDALAHRLATAGAADVSQLRRELLAVRHLYLRTETTVDFFADALATRTSEPMGSWLRACDHIAIRAMTEVLQPMGRDIPAVLTFADKGAGAAIWKMGLRLWDGTVRNPVAVLRMSRHNMMRPTAVLHEVGHQLAHVLGWTAELRTALHAAVHARAPVAADTWAAWASEIAGDAFAFAFTGYGAVSALHDVVDGDARSAFMLIPGDPHPVAHLRVLLGVAMCRRAFGDGRWDRLAASWNATHTAAAADRDVRPIIDASLPALGAIVEAVLYKPFRAFGNRPLVALVDPSRVSPTALDRLRRDIGHDGMRSRHWMWDEAIRLLALTSYHTTRDATSLREGVQQQDAVMRRIGTPHAA